MIVQVLFLMFFFEKHPQLNAVELQVETKKNEHHH